MTPRHTIGQVAKALHANHGNVNRTAAQLGLNAVSLWGRIRRHVELATALSQAREKASTVHVCKACKGMGVVE